MEQPITIDLDAVQNAQGISVERLVCQSQFLEIAVSGTPEKLAGKATFDLTELMVELDQFIDLDQQCGPVLRVQRLPFLRPRPAVALQGQPHVVQRQPRFPPVGAQQDRNDSAQISACVRGRAGGWLGCHDPVAPLPDALRPESFSFQGLQIGDDVVALARVAHAYRHDRSMHLIGG